MTDQENYTKFIEESHQNIPELNDDLFRQIKNEENAFIEFVKKFY